MHACSLLRMLNAFICMFVACFFFKFQCTCNFQMYMKTIKVILIPIRFLISSLKMYVEKHPMDCVYVASNIATQVLLDADGYGVIVDLGFAKVVHDKTFTLCGTPEYLAPETIMSKGHDHAVDDWAFGVLTYELLVGVTPFFDRFASQTEMFRKIVLVQYEIPDFVDEDAATLIKGLLVRKQKKRLGNLARGAFDIKDSQWFKKTGINFRDLVRKRVEAPWKPPVNSSLDVSKITSSVVGADRDASRRLTRKEQEMFRDF